MKELEGVKIIEQELGDQYSGVRIGGYWVIGRTDTPGRPFDRVSPEPLRRSLKLAIDDVRKAGR